MFQGIFSWISVAVLTNVRNLGKHFCFSSVNYLVLGSNKSPVLVALLKPATYVSYVPYVPLTTTLPLQQNCMFVYVIKTTHLSDCNANLKYQAKVF